ncbi:endonuclease/exonuclease/phosphatase family protein [Streptosporangium soli]|nr:endonuclease/exonuclease/phosphatase family protein [Streptosporangium sp. KLBMP 9127]
MTTVTTPRSPAQQDATGRWCLGTRLVITGTSLWAAFLLAHVLLSGRWWPWALVELAPPLVLIVVPALLLAVTPLAARRTRWPVAVTLSVTLVLGIPWSGLSLASFTAPPAAAGLKIFSWNADYWSQADDPETFFDFLRSQRADIYLLQEYLHYTNGPIKIDDLARIRAAFPGYHVAAASELVTISRLPISAAHPIAAANGSAPPPGSVWDDYYTTKALRTDISVGDRLVSFYNVHLAVQVNPDMSPLSGDFYQFVREQYHRRVAHLNQLRENLSANENQVVVAGDFNSTPWMREIRQFCGDLTCHDPAGSGLYPVSWNAQDRLRLWRLDWVLSRGDMTVSGYRFVEGRGMSDHVAQVFTLS